MAFDSGVVQRGIFVMAEGKNSLVHLFGIKHPQSRQWNNISPTPAKSHSLLFALLICFIPLGSLKWKADFL